ncbi:MAG: hypothetical protein M3P08_01765 [Thermoproteota archaeon]|nr:hypothetical protein [Thermoproteota archaeon]
MSAIVFVTIRFVLILLISQNIGFSVIPFSIQEAKAITQKGNTNPSSSSSRPQSNTASPGSCINYNPSTRTIIVSCSSPTGLSDIDNKLHDGSILAKQFTNGVWFLNANLVIANGATFHIDSTDTKCLKISSNVIHVGVVWMYACNGYFEACDEMLLFHQPKTQISKELGFSFNDQLYYAEQICQSRYIFL